MNPEIDPLDPLDLPADWLDRAGNLIKSLRRIDQVISWQAAYRSAWLECSIRARAEIDKLARQGCPVCGQKSAGAAEVKTAPEL
jgi:hypothetical protein